MAENITRQEDRLLLYLKKLAKEALCARTRALYIRVSRLQGFNKTSFVNSVDDMISPIVLLKKGQKFQLTNEDIVLFYFNNIDDEIAAIVFKTKFFLSDKEKDIVKIYDLKTEYKDFYDLVADLVAADNKALLEGNGEVIDDLHAEDEVRKEIVNERKENKKIPDKALTPRELCNVENRLRGADLANMIRRQPACAIIGKSAPQPMFDEVFVSVSDLRDMLLPDANFALTPWLFQHLTSTLDKRVLASINRHDDGSFKEHFSINLNVSTILSGDFVKFDKGLSPSVKNTIFLELQPVDIFSDLSSYTMAHSFVKERGYKICIDGVTVDSIHFIDAKKLEADIIKLIWHPSMVELAKDNESQLVKDIQRNNPQKIVLTRVDDEKALEVGHILGINIFQGRYIQQLIAADPKRRRVSSFYIAH